MANSCISVVHALRKVCNRACCTPTCTMSDGSGTKSCRAAVRCGANPAKRGLLYLVMHIAHSMIILQLLKLATFQILSVGIITCQLKL